MSNIELSTQANVPANGEHKPAIAFGRVYPAIDVCENEEEFLVVADVPGVEPSTLEVELEGGKLYVRGKQSDPQVWFEPQEFQRVFPVPEDADPEQVSADLKDGILQITLKKRPAARPRRIEVRAVN